MSNIENQVIIDFANSIVKNASFTKLVKPRKNAVCAFLIVVRGDGLALYGAYNSRNYYVSLNNGNFMKLA